MLTTKQTFWVLAFKKLLPTTYEIATMILIVDGYNLLFHSLWQTQGYTLEQKREHLIKEIAKYRSRYLKSRIIIVFDGQSNIGPYNQHDFRHQIEIIYAVCSGKADEKIISLAENLTGVQVVTADREIIRKVRRRRALTTSPEQFIMDLKHPNVRESKEREVPNSPMGEAEIEKWLNLFGLDEEIEL